MNKNEYDANLFLNRLKNKIKSMPPCPFCGNSSYSVDPNAAQIIVQSKMTGIVINRTLPNGIVYCNNCGYLHLFVLGAYDMVPQQEGTHNER